MGFNYVQPGSTITIPAPADLASGDVVIAGGIIGIAAGNAAAGESVDVLTGGVFDLAKVGANNFTLGATVYWDSTAGLCTTTSSGNTKIGIAVAVAGASTASVKVRLSGF